MKFNHKKSAILTSRGKYMKNVCHLVFKLHGEDIKETNSVKYLGHNIIIYIVILRLTKI